MFTQQHITITAMMIIDNDEEPLAMSKGLVGKLVAVLMLNFLSRIFYSMVSRGHTYLCVRNLSCTDIEKEPLLAVILKTYATL